jgi:hypothetical protein
LTDGTDGTTVVGITVADDAPEFSADPACDKAAVADIEAPRDVPTVFSGEYFVSQTSLLLFPTMLYVI